MTDSNLIPQEEDKENTVPEGAFGIGSKTTDDLTKQYQQSDVSLGKQAAGLGIEIGGGLVSDVATAPLLGAGPFGWLAYGGIQFGVGASLNIAAQKARGEKNINIGEVISSGVLQIPPFGVEAKGAAGIAKSAGYGGAMGLGDQIIQKGINEQRLPTYEEGRNSILLGSGLGIGFKASTDKIQDLFSKLNVNRFVGKTPDEINKIVTPQERKQIEEISSEIDMMKAKADRFGIDDIQGDTIDDIDATKVQQTDTTEKVDITETQTVDQTNVEKIVKAPKGKGKGKGKKTQDLGDENILPGQVNLNQLASTPRQARFLEKVLRGMKLEEDASGFYRVKTMSDTTDEAVDLMANSDELKELAKLMQQIYKILPSDSLNVALSGYIKLTSGSISNQTKSLLDLTNLDVPLDSMQQIEEGAELLIKHFDDYDEWLRLGIPLRSEAGRGLGSLAYNLENFSISKEEYLKLSIPERKKLQERTRGDADIAANYQSIKIKDLQKNIRDTLAEAKQTGDFTKFNKFLYTIDRAKGNPQKIKKLFEYGLLDRLLSPNTYLRPLNEILINGVLYAPTIHEINILSNVIMAYKTPLKLALDPRNVMQPERYKAALLHFLYMHSDLNYALKAMGESWQKQENILNPGSRKIDYPEQFATYVDTTDLTGPHKWLGQLWNPIGTFARGSGRAMTSTDALFQAGNIRGGTVSSAFLEGMKLGLTGEDLSKFTVEKSNIVWESIIKKTGKNITEDVEARILKSALELGKRNTFTQDIRTDGDVVGPLGKGFQELAKIPIVRRFQMFTRSPVNIIKEGFRDTFGINLLMKEFRNDLQSDDALVQAEAMGQLTMSILAAGGFIGLIHGQNFMKIETQDQVKERTKRGNPPRVVLTGGGVNTTTAEGREQWWRDWTTGWRPYSAGFLQFDENGEPKIGEDGQYVYVYHSYKRLDPLSSFVGWLVDMHQVQEYYTDGEYTDMMSAFLVAFGRNFTDRTFTQGLGDAANLWLNPGKAEKWFARQGASNIPGSGLLANLKQIPKDLLQMKGVPDSEIEKYVVKRDKTVRPGDKEFLGLARMFNEAERTMPFYGDHLPPQREHITNNFIKRPHRRGFDLFNWVESSETINHPVLTLQKKLGRTLPPPSDKITHSDKDINTQSDPLELTGPLYDDLQKQVNEFEIGGLTLDQALRQYMKTPHYKENMAIIEEADSPLDVPMAVDMIWFGDSNRDIKGIMSLNRLYIRKATDDFIENLSSDSEVKNKARLKKQTRILEYYKKGKEAQEKTESGAFN